MLKKKRGRPSNAYKRKVKTIKVLGIVSIISIIGITLLTLNSSLKSNNIKGDITQVPRGSIIKDLNFHKCAIDGYNSSNEKKLDYNHRLVKSELSKIESISCPSGYPITNLKGIEYMKNLTSLDISINNYKRSIINFRNNKKLKSINLYAVPINFNNIKLPFSDYVYNKTNYEYNNSIYNLRLYKVQLKYDYYYNGREISLYNQLSGLNSLTDNKNYYNVSKMGTYKIDVKPYDNYYWNDGTSDKKTITFNILPCDISKVKTKIRVASLTYTGSEQKPEVEVYVYQSEIKDYEILLEDYYTIKYENNINVGSNAKVIITGKGNYIGTITKNFTIKERREKEGTLSISADDRLLKAKCGNGSVKFVIKGTDISNNFALYDSKRRSVGNSLGYSFSNCTDKYCVGYIDKTYKDFYIFVTRKNGKEYNFGPYSTCVNKQSKIDPKTVNIPAGDRETIGKNNVKVSVDGITADKILLGERFRFKSNYKIQSIKTSTDKNKWKESTKCIKSKDGLIAVCTANKKYKSLYYRIIVNDEYIDFGPYEVIK